MDQQNESNEVKLFGLTAGDEVTVTFGGVDYTLQPLPFGKGPALARAYQKTFSRLFEVRAKLFPEVEKAIDEQAERERAGEAIPDEQRVKVPESPELDEALEEQLAERIVAAARLIQWSLKKWSAPKPLELEKVRFGGKPYEIVSEKQLYILTRMYDGELVLFLARMLIALERLRPREATGFKPPSGA